MSQVDPERRTRAEEQKPDPYVGRTFDGFRIDSVIGRGGMGVVYKATQLSLNRPVAIKLIPEHVAEHPQFLERFHREVDVLSKLSHPNIVTVIDRGEVDGHPYLVMEYVAGTSLREVVKEGSLPAHEALVIVRGVLAALEHAHDRGIIHRDIKPENVLVAPGGIVKVADFGLGRLLGPTEMTRLTHTHLMLGTFEYMAPEQREKAKEADERADIYATGVVLYELIAGELPIGHFEKLSAKRPSECDSRVDRVVERSLEKSPERRYQRASEMGNAVSELLTPLPAAPPPREEKPEEKPAPSHHTRSAGRHDWKVGMSLTALWVLPAWILSGQPWRNEQVFWLAVAAGVSMAVFARWAAKHPRPREEWSLGIGLTAAWVILVCVFADKPWRDEEYLWLGVGALLSAFLIPRLKEAGKFVFWIVAVALVPIVVFALFWGVSGTDEPERGPDSPAVASTGSTDTSLLCTLRDGGGFDMSFFEDRHVSGWVGLVALRDPIFARGKPDYLESPVAEGPGGPSTGLFVRFRDGEYSAEKRLRIIDAWKLALHHWRGVDVETSLPRQRLEAALRTCPLPELDEGRSGAGYRYFVAARPLGWEDGRVSLPPKGAREWVREALADIPAARWATVHVSMYDGTWKSAGDTPGAVEYMNGRWGLWVELEDDVFSGPERRRIVNAWALAFSHFYGVRQAARPWKDEVLQAELRGKHPLPRIAENGKR